MFFLFNTTTDDLEDDFLESERHIPDDWSPLPETPGMARDEVRPPTSPPRDMGPVASSTPLRVRRRPTDSEEVEDSLGQPFVFVAGTVNAPPAPRPPLVEPPAEPNHWTRAAWKRRRVRAYKYVDDGITTEKVNFENATPGPDLGSKPTKRKQAIPSQNAFLATAHSAHAKGMKVNTLKTNLLCVSDAVSFAPVAFIEAGGEVLESSPGQRLKVLGFTLGDRPSVKPHVQTIIKKFRQRYWTLFNLKKHGFSNDELVTVYKTMILPLADYCDVVYHSLLTDEMDEELDRQQNHALRCIFGFGIGGKRLRAMAGLTTLRERRIAHCDAFAAKCSRDPRFEHFFPRRESKRRTRSSLGGEEFLETFARCDRLRDSPIHFFRRRLNGKTGKIYGQRYKEYRED